MPSINDAALSLEQRKGLYPNYDKMVATTRDAAAVDAWLMAMPLRDLCEEFKSPIRDWAGRPLLVRPPHHKGAVKVDNTSGYRFVNPQGWERYESVPCATWLIPNQYINLREGPFLRDFLISRFPYLEGLNLKAYGLQGGDRPYEVYVGTEADTPYPQLYCPVDAFFAGDPQLITDRTVSYLKWYLAGKLSERFPIDVHAYAAVQSGTAKALFAAMETGHEPG